jgi:nucleoside-diphosphate-sugar epimerase
MGRILITGATVFVGGYLLPTLLRQHEVFALARKEPASDVSAGLQWLRQDLTRPLEVSQLPERVDSVIHLAQSKFYRQFPEGAQDIFAVNIESTFHLLEYARKAGVACFIFASSGGVYGYSYERLVETDPVSPLNFYLSSKYTAELLLANYQQYFRTIVLRLFFAYGPGQEGMLIPSLLDRVRAGQEITIEGNPGIAVNPIYVEDAIRVFEPALDLRTSELFNVAGDEAVTITDLVHLMEEVVGKKAVVRYAQAKKQGDLVGENARMKQLLGVIPQTSLVQGLRKTVQALDRSGGER